MEFKVKYTSIKKRVDANLKPNESVVRIKVHENKSIEFNNDFHRYEINKFVSYGGTSGPVISKTIVEDSGLNIYDLIVNTTFDLNKQSKTRIYESIAAIINLSEVESEFVLILPIKHDLGLLFNELSWINTILIKGHIDTDGIRSIIYSLKDIFYLTLYSDIIDYLFSPLIKGCRLIQRNEKGEIIENEIAEKIKFYTSSSDSCFLLVNSNRYSFYVDSIRRYDHYKESNKRLFLDVELNKFEISDNPSKINNNLNILNIQRVKEVEDAAWKERCEDWDRHYRPNIRYNTSSGYYEEKMANSPFYNNSLFI